MSSRNQHLSENERIDARVLFQALDIGRRLYESGEKRASAILSEMITLLNKTDSSRIDYVSIVDENMQKVESAQKGYILALAVYIGATRLIDNYVFGDSIA